MWNSVLIFVGNVGAWILDNPLVVLGSVAVLYPVFWRLTHLRALIVRTWGNPAKETHIDGKEISDSLGQTLEKIWLTHSNKGTQAHAEATYLENPKREGEELGSRAVSVVSALAQPLVGALAVVSSWVWPMMELEGEIVLGDRPKRFCGARLKKGKNYYHAWQIEVPDGRDAVRLMTEELAYRVALDSARLGALDETRSAGTRNWKAFRALTEALQLWAVEGFNHENEASVLEVDQKLVEAIREDPGYSLAHLNRGILWLRTHRSAETNERARGHFLEAARLAKEQALKAMVDKPTVDRRIEGMAAMGLSRTYSQDRHRYGRTDEEVAKKARVAANDAVTLLPDNPEALYALAFAWHCTETLTDIEEAVIIYDRIIGKRNRGKYPSVHTNLGYILMLAGERHRDDGNEKKKEEMWERAEMEMKDAIKSSTDGDRTIQFSRANLGNLRRLQGRYEESEREYLKALAPDPTTSKYTEGLNEMARLLFEIGRRTEEAEDYHRRALGTTEDLLKLEKLKREVEPFRPSEQPPSS